MRKIISVLLAVFMLTAALAGCGQGDAGKGSLRQMTEVRMNDSPF